MGEGLPFRSAGPAGAQTAMSSVGAHVYVQVDNARPLLSASAEHSARCSALSLTGAG
jgi:hypothetical protein